VAGIAAVLRYARERSEGLAELFSPDDVSGNCVATFQLSLERAACALAGLPMPEKQRVTGSCGPMDEDEAA
jgi:hypothetical protein